jgi:hypothetical protein
MRIEMHAVPPCRPARASPLVVGLWFACWTLGGIGTLHGLAAPTWGARIGSLLWLCGSAFGEAILALLIVRQIADPEPSVAMPDSVGLRKPRRLDLLAPDRTFGS